MNNKLTVTIAGREYTLVAAEDAAYMEKVARLVDKKVSEVPDSAGVSSTEAAILAALNIADDYLKEVAAAEALRAQIKEYLQEATSLKMQLAEANREIFALKNKKG